MTKGLFFLLAFPALGVFGIGWEWTPSLLVEGWLIGLFWGTFIFMRKALRSRFTLEHEGLPVADVSDE